MEDTNEVMKAVVSSACAFISDLCSCYGADEGIAAWEAIGEALPDEVKQLVFLEVFANGALVTRRLTFSAPPNHVRLGPSGILIPLIKAIRASAPLSLKEAKDLAEQALAGSATLVLPSTAAARKLRTELRALGITVD